MSTPRPRLDPASQAILAEVHRLIDDEGLADAEKLLETWQRPLPEKLEKGLTQRFLRLARGDEPGTLWAWPDDGESRFREGDMICLHEGDPCDETLARQLSLEHETDTRWLLRGKDLPLVWGRYSGGACFADVDSLNLTHLYEKALEEIATSRIGRDAVLPLLTGKLEITFDGRDLEQGEAIAEQQGFNAAQAEAVGLAYAAEQIACIQGPPGTGKTRVLGLIAQLMVERGERVLVTSHTHTAINNALNGIHGRGVLAVKVGGLYQCRGLNAEIDRVESMSGWGQRPTNDGYVVGATPFATCTQRLEQFEFDAIIFDEASQVTVPLALMAMRKGKRFIFIGDQRQLPPVLLSRSVLAKESHSAFSRLVAQGDDHTVMLEQCYRMNRWLTEWPSRQYYAGRLQAVGGNRDRRLCLDPAATRYTEIFSPDANAVFIATLDSKARDRNHKDASLVATLCGIAHDGGVSLADMGVVSPFRAHGRAIRTQLARRFGHQAAMAVVADTVERMQGQERELVILSLASGDISYLAAIAEFFFQPQRLNVSITRAKTRLIIIGPDATRLPTADNPEVQQWIAAYEDLIGQCRRVDVEHEA